MSFCPHCGFNLKADETIKLGNWLVSPTDAYLNGERVKLTRQQVGLLHTLAQAKGRTVSIDAIAARISHSDSPNLVSVVVSHLRQRLPDCPIETVHWSGYRWAMKG